MRPNDVSVRTVLPILGLLLAACGSPADDVGDTTSSVAESTTTSTADPGSTTTDADSNPATTIGEIEMPVARRKPHERLALRHGVELGRHRLHRVQR